MMAFDIRTFLFNTMCLLCGCVFIIFEIQSTIFEKTIEYNLPPPAAYTSNEIQSHPLPHYQSLNKTKSDKAKYWHVRGKNYEIPQIWISMGLCWSNNAQYYGKEHFPYREAAPLSAQLWMRLSPSIKVVLYVVYSESEPTQQLIEYKEKLENFGTLVKLVPQASGLTCVLESQLIRIMAYLLPTVCLIVWLWYYIMLVWFGELSYHKITFSLSYSVMGGKRIVGQNVTLSIIICY